MVTSTDSLLHILVERLKQMSERGSEKPALEHRRDIDGQDLCGRANWSSGAEQFMWSQEGGEDVVLNATCALKLKYDSVFLSVFHLKRFSDFGTLLGFASCHVLFALMASWLHSVSLGAALFTLVHIQVSLFGWPQPLLLPQENQVIIKEKNNKHSWSKQTATESDNSVAAYLIYMAKTSERLRLKVAIQTTFNRN